MLEIIEMYIQKERACAVLMCTHSRGLVLVSSSYFVLNIRADRLCPPEWRGGRRQGVGGGPRSG